MIKGDVEKLLNLLCNATVEAIDGYLDSSGESIEQMPEFVMSAGAAHRLADCGKSTILEANFDTLQKRLRQPDGKEIAVALDKIKVILKLGRVDLVILSDESDRELRKPVGFVEFKKWKYDKGDALRVADLLAGIPGAEFGACVVIRNTPADDRWHYEMRQSLGQSGFVLAKDAKRRFNQIGHCVACLAKLGS